MRILKHTAEIYRRVFAFKQLCVFGTVAFISAFGYIGRLRYIGVGSRFGLRLGEVYCDIFSA